MFRRKHGLQYSNLFLLIVVSRSRWAGLGETGVVIAVKYKMVQIIDMKNPIRVFGEKWVGEQV